FNTLQFEIIDATFVEVFSGSGSIGLEALSRVQNASSLWNKIEMRLKSSKKISLKQIQMLVRFLQETVLRT
ncbi:MAG: RsmD family RNA methyltransferase, partial [Sulfurimonas sp.]|nr:RsmD family RNA methyltransferase [Sulfurimonas sp.]